MMKKLILTAMTALTLLAPATFMASPVLAANEDPFETVCNNGGADSQVCKGQDTITGNTGVVTRVANLIAVIGGILAVIMLIVAGIMFALAGGDSGRIKLARDTVIYTLVGVALLALTRVIVAFTIGLT